MFDKEGKKILVAGRIEDPGFVNDTRWAVKEFVLSEGERWVGVESGSRGRKYGE